MKKSKGTFLQRPVDDDKPRVGSKKSVQRGRSHFCARSVLVRRKHGTMARTPLAAYFDIPIWSFLLSQSATHLVPV